MLSETSSEHGSSSSSSSNLPSSGLCCMQDSDGTGNVSTALCFKSISSLYSDDKGCKAWHRCLGTFPALQGGVFSLSARTNDRLISGSQNGEIMVWQQREEQNGGKFSMEPVCNLAKGDACVKFLLQVTSGSGKNLVFSAHQDNKIRVWKMTVDESGSYKLSATLPTATDIARICLWPRNYIKIRRHRKCLWVQHSDTISSLAQSWDGSVVFSCSWDRTIKVWRVSDLKCLDSFRAHHDAINAIAASPEGFLYSGSADSTIKVWKRSSVTKKFSLVSTLSHHRKPTKHESCASSVNALVLGSDGYLLYSGMSDSSIVVWERCAGADEEESQGQETHMIVVEALKGHRLAVLCLARAADLLCSGSADMTVRLWSRDRAGGSHYCLGVLKGHSGAVKCVTVVAAPLTMDQEGARDDHQQPQEELDFVVYSGGLDKQIRVWKVSGARMNDGVPGPPPYPLSSLAGFSSSSSSSEECGSISLNSSSDSSP